MNKENKLIPELRFPEFVNEGEWEEIKFEKICKFIRGPFGGALKKEIFVRDGYAVYEQSHAIYNDFSSFRYFISEDKFNELKRFSIYPFDIIMSCSGTMGKFAIIPKEPKKGIINQALLKLTVREEYNVCFIKEILQLPVNQDKLLSQSAGGAIKNVAEVAQIKEIKLLIPKHAEQQKIASCLSSLDELITAHNQKLALLKDHKKGLMQNLFPQKSELGFTRLKDDGIIETNKKKILQSANPKNPNSDNIPKCRFKEFEKDGEWVEKTFEQLFIIGNGRDYKHLNSGDIPVYGSGGYMLSVNEFLNDGESVCIGRKGTIDKPMFLTGKFWTVDTLFYTHSFSNCLPKYIFYVFENINWREHNEAGGVPSLSKTNLYKIKVLVPPNDEIEEQQKIASTLSSLDELITAQAEKIEQLKQHKKGLMQGLFPKVV
jgi:type I restriction enzyme S subunit